METISDGLKPPEFCEPAKHLLVAIPSYSGQPSAETIQSLMNSVGFTCTASLMICAGHCYVDQARNSIVTSFLAAEQFTDLLFLDDDVGFAPDAIAKITAARRPYVAGIYPKKMAQEEFPCDLLPGLQATNAEGLLEAAMVPTGFLRLNRKVFEVVPYIPYEDDNGNKFKGYFKTFIEGRYIGEDVFFSHHWRSLGGRIWTIPDIDFTHTGRYIWKGNFHQHLLKTCERKEAAD